MNKPVSWRKFGAAIALATTFALGACGGGSGSTTPTSSGSSGGTTPTPTPSPAVTPASIALGVAAPNPIRVKSDNSNTTTLTALVLDSSNAGIPNQTVSFSATSGFLTSASVVTDATGHALATFSAGADPTNRTATISATVAGLTKTFPILVYGSTASGLINPTTPLPNDGSVTATYTITAVDASGAAVNGAAVTFSQSGGGSVSITPASATTDVNGQAAVTVRGLTAGSATITAHVLGTTVSQAVNVSQGAVANSFGIELVAGAPIQASHQAAAQLNVGTQIQVNAPNSTTVEFVSTLGTWDNTGSNVELVAVNGSGKAVATLTSPLAGIANIQVYDPTDASARTDNLSIAVTSATAAKVFLQATPTVVSRAVGNQGFTSTIVATVQDSSGAPVGNAPVAFSIINPTGGGETLSSVVAFTAATTQNGQQLGQATTNVHTGSVLVPNPPSGPDAAVVIGGTAGSVSIGQSTALGVDPNNNAVYIMDMTALVADSNNNPVANTVVSFSAWPVAFNTSTQCTIGTWICGEDTNENLILDGGEDGTRLAWPNCTQSLGVGTRDGKLTPVNSDGGSVPATVTTDSNGIANFQLRYNKSVALHVIDRIRASAIVQGTETVGQVEFILPALTADLGPPTCLLPNSPFQF